MNQPPGRCFLFPAHIDTVCQSIFFAHLRFIHCCRQRKHIAITQSSYKAPCTVHSKCLKWSTTLDDFCVSYKSLIEQLWNTQKKNLFKCTNKTYSFCIVFKTFLSIIVYNEVIVICNQGNHFYSLCIIWYWHRNKGLFCLHHFKSYEICTINYLKKLFLSVSLKLYQKIRFWTLVTLLQLHKLFLNGLTHETL